MQAFVFDLDGTLVDTVPPHCVAWQAALAEAGMHPSVRAIEFWIGVGSQRLAETFARRAKRSLDDAALERMRSRHQQWMQANASPPPILPGAKALLTTLRARQIPFGIATSGRPKVVRHALEVLELGGDLPLVTIEDVSHHKPHPEALQRCAEKIGVASSDCIMVGDAVWDMYAARRAGMLPIGMRTGGASERRLRKSGARFLFRDPGQLLQRLDDVLDAR